jgi:hypothetical protein
MAQEDHRYRQSFVVHVPTAGFVAQLYGPAPDDPWDDKALWGDLAGWGLPATTRLRIEYSRPVLPDGTVGQDPAGPADVVAIVQTKDREGVVLNARLPLLAAEGAVAIEAVELRREDGQPLGRRALARMGLGAVYKALEKVLQSQIAQAHLGDQWTLEVPFPGRPGRSDLFYAETALEYVRALDAEPNTPVRHMVDEAAKRGDHMTPDELRARLRRARDRKLLTKALPGKAGGRLTAKAKRVLRKAGLIEEDS